MTAGGISYPHFVDASVAWGVPQDRVPQFDPTAADFDGDGDLDIFVGRRAVEWDSLHCSLDEPVPDILLVNQHANGTSGFVESAVTYGVADPGDAYGAAWGDVDNDGDLDLLLANNRHPVQKRSPAPGDTCSGKTDNMMKLYRNNVPSPFNTFAVPDFEERFALQINNGAVFFDYDLDGLQDFFIAVEADTLDWGDMLFRQESPGVFQERSQAEGVVQPFLTGSECNPQHRVPEGTNGTYADFDGDGDLDLFVPRGDRPVGDECGRRGDGTLVFRNLTRDTGGGNYLVLRLHGRDGGAFAALGDAIGSKAHVYVGSGVYMQQVCAGGQDGSTWPLDLTFGLGTATSVDSVVVEWLNTGTDPSPIYEETFQGPFAANQKLNLFLENTIEVPQNEQTIARAMTLAIRGTTIVVAQGDEPYGPVILRKSVTVTAALGQTPVVNAGDTARAVTFPLDADALTAVDGLTLRGGTSEVVRLRGAGVLRNCTVDAVYALTPVGVAAPGSEGTIENCTVQVSNGKGFDLGAFYGVVSGGSVTVSGTGTGIDWGGDGSLVENVTILVNEGAGVSGFPASGELRDCDITVGDGTGIDVLGNDPVKIVTVTDCDVLVTTGVGVQATGRVHAQGCDIRVTSGEVTNVGVHLLGGGGGPLLVEGSFVSVPAGPSGLGGWGAKVEAGVLYGTTIHGAAYGVETSGTGSVANCIASDYFYAGFFGPANTYCLAPGPSGFSPGPGTGSLEADPLYCDAASGNLTLRIDSYGNPGNNPSGEQIGAFPVACAYGTLARNATLLAGTAATVWQDVSVPNGKTLTLQDNACLLFDPVDESGGGSYSTKNELLVLDDAHLTVSAAEGGRATFTSNAVPPSPGSWGMIQIQGGASVSLDHAQIEYADVGLHYLSDDPANLVQDVVFANNNLEDVRVDKALSGPNGPDGRFVNCTFGSDGAYGVRVNWDAQDLRFEDCTWSGSSTPLVGLAWEYSGGTVQGGLVTGFTAGTGIRAINSAAPTCTGVTFGNNKYGVEWRNTAAGQISGCTFNAGTGSAPYDIWVRNTAAPLITGNVFPAASLATAVRTDDSAHPTVETSNTITSHLIGLSAQGSSTPVFRGNTVSGCTYGVSAAKTAHPNLGTEASWGNNSITGSTNMAVLSKSRTDSLTAKRNWWGIDPPIPAKFSAYVGYTPWLHQPPGGLGMAARNVTPVLVSMKERLLVSPNPMRQEASFTIMGTDEQAGTAQIFDVTGRLVRVLPFVGSDPMTVTWDGTDRWGGRVPGGVYLYRVQAGGFEDKGRVVVVR